MYQVEKISLRKGCKKDATILNAIRKDTELQKLLLGSRDPITETTETWVQRKILSDYFRIIELEGLDAIGYVQVDNIHQNNRTGWLGMCIVKEQLGKGYGGKAIKLLLDDIKTNFNLRKILLYVRDDNPAQRLYEKLDFNLVGKLKQEYWCGSYLWDVRLYERLL